MVSLEEFQFQCLGLAILSGFILVILHTVIGESGKNRHPTLYMILYVGSVIGLILAASVLFIALELYV